jgi:hypothetical protein
LRSQARRAAFRRQAVYHPSTESARLLFRVQDGRISHSWMWGIRKSWRSVVPLAAPGEENLNAEAQRRRDGEKGRGKGTADLQEGRIHPTQVRAYPQILAIRCHYPAPGEENLNAESRRRRGGERRGAGGSGVGGKGTADFQDGRIKASRVRAYPQILAIRCLSPCAGGGKSQRRGAEARIHPAQVRAYPQILAIRCPFLCASAPLRLCVKIPPVLASFHNLYIVNLTNFAKWSIMEA